MERMKCSIVEEGRGGFYSMVQYLTHSGTEFQILIAMILKMIGAPYYDMCLSLTLCTYGWHNLMKFLVDGCKVKSMDAHFHQH